jgi:hypothetical protein
MSEPHQAPIEAERRRPEGEFRPDVGIVLSDGVTWYLPKPRVIGQYFTPSGKGELTDVGITEYGAEYDFRAEELIVDMIHHRAKTAAFFWFGSFLLKRNYALEDREMYWLLRFDDSQENLRMWMDIMGVAVGMIFMDAKDPKASTPDGTTFSAGRDTVSSATASTPAA